MILQILDRQILNYNKKPHFCKKLNSDSSETFKTLSKIWKAMKKTYWQISFLRTARPKKKRRTIIIIIILRLFSFL